MKKLLPSFILFFTLLNAYAQQEYSVFTAAGRGTATTFVTDYHVIGINPANLGFKRTYENKHVTFGLTEFAVSAYSEALQKKEFRESITSFGSNDFSYQDKLNAFSKFSGTNLALNLDVNWFGISYQHDKIGGFALNIRESARWYSNFNTKLSELMFLGYKASYFDSLQLSNGTMVVNDPSQYASYDAIGIEKGIRKQGTAQLYSQLFEGSKISMILYREYALAYGKEVKLSDLFAVSGGVSLKYLQGYGMVDIQVKDGVLTSTSVFSPAFNVNLGAATSTNPSADTSGSYRSVGKGMGFDFGFNLYYKEKIKLGFAFTNLGSITWDGNVYTAKDTSLYNMESEGFDSYNVFAEAGNIVSSEGLFKWEGKQKIKTTLPSMFRVGLSHQMEDKAEVGIDVVVPMNDQPGTIKKAYWAIGGDFKVFRFLRLSSGMSWGGNYSTRLNVPLGITFLVGEHASWEVGFASRDFITYFRDKGPALSVAFGFLRFRV